jgi:ABC-2 type transport system ATP-binding protein
MSPIIEVQGLGKTYDTGFTALKDVNLSVQRGEIFALLGPNGAGKSTLINIICGLVRPTTGSVLVGGYDIIKDYRKTREIIGLVPQELTTDSFESVWNTVSFSRGLFGKKKNPAFLEKLLKDLALWEKRNNRILTLSGGMKRRVMIAKALSHEPMVLFLDEPTAGVDVELRKSMWNQVHALRESGVTVILTTHYIDEAEEMADRIGVIDRGKLILVENKADLMSKLGSKELILDLKNPLSEIPSLLAPYKLSLTAEGSRMVYTYDTSKEDNGIANLLEDLKASGVLYKDLNTRQSSLEDIFVKLVRQP